MGLFSCCMGERKVAAHEKEARHARIVEIYAQAETESQTSTPVPPPAYNEIICDHLSGTTIFVDEKDTQTAPQPATQAHSAGLDIPRPDSPQTSVYSVPSTRLTDITSAHTGCTLVGPRTYQGDSPRSSLVFDSAPPSYYDGRSIRERSRSPNRERGSHEQMRYHPALSQNWQDIVDHITQMENSRHAQ